LLPAVSRVLKVWFWRRSEGRVGSYSSKANLLLAYLLSPTEAPHYGFTLQVPCGPNAKCTSQTLPVVTSERVCVSGNGDSTDHASVYRTEL